MGGGLSHVGRQIPYLDDRDTPDHTPTRSRSGQVVGCTASCYITFALKRVGRMAAVVKILYLSDVYVASGRLTSWEFGAVESFRPPVAVVGIT